MLRNQYSLIEIFFSKVASVNYSESPAVVTTGSGSLFKADKVVVTVPLAVLQAKAITFTPTLPKEKQEAIDLMGAGVVEKVLH